MGVIGEVSLQRTNMIKINTVLSRKIQIYENRTFFVGYPLGAPISTEFLQSFCTRNPKKSGFFDRFEHVLFSVEEVPVEGLY